ncbi:VOC family protein [Streptomyces sp. NPDC004596]
MAGTGGRPGVFPAPPYTDAKAAIRQLTAAFGLTARSVHETADCMVTHSGPVRGESATTVGSRGRRTVFDTAVRGAAGPAGVYVVADDSDDADDSDAHHRRAVEHGAESMTPPADPEHGSRDHVARDAEGDVRSVGTCAPGTGG